MTHKEQMDYLKKYDPITYSELTTDPCGTDSGGDDFGCSLIMIGLAIVVIVGAVFLIN